MGTPTLVVEVLSELTRKKDLLKKLNLYLCSGVEEYWIVNPLRKEVYTYGFTEGDIKEYRVHKGGDTVISAIFGGLEVPLAQIFS